MPPPRHPIIIGTTTTLYSLRLSLISNASCWYFVLYHSSWFQCSFLVGMPCCRSRLFSFVCLLTSSLVVSMLLFFLNGIRSPTPTSHLCSLKHVLFPTFLCTTLFDCQSADVLSPMLDYARLCSIMSSGIFTSSQHFAFC